MPTGDAHFGKPPRCAFVLVHENAIGFVDHVESVGLPETELEILRKEMRAVTWGAARFRQLARERGWPPLAFVRGRPPILPPPCATPFEPTLLSAAEPMTHALIDLMLEQGDPQTRERLRRMAGRSEHGKMALLASLSGAMMSSMTVLFYFGLARLATNRIAGLAMIILLQCALAYAFLRLVAKRNWYIVPGGVVIRRFRGSGDARLRVLSPENSVLVANRGLVHIFDRNSGKSFRVNCGVLEAAILLAVWQSPFLPPDESKLVDLR